MGPWLFIASWSPPPTFVGADVKVVYFTHSLASCWNHGNDHFLTSCGVLRDCIQPIHHIGRERWIAMQPADPTPPTRG